jgi:hypothetical protein
MYYVPYKEYFHPQTLKSTSMTAHEALNKSYLSWDEIMRRITVQAEHQQTCLAYQMISPVDAQRLKELGYSVFTKVGDGNQTTIHWGDAIKERYKNGKREAGTIPLP